MWKNKRGFRQTHTQLKTRLPRSYVAASFKDIVNDNANNISVLQVTNRQNVDRLFVVDSCF